MVWKLEVGSLCWEESFSWEEEAFVVGRWWLGGFVQFDQ